MDDSLLKNRETIARIAASHGAGNLRVFGSRARNDARQDSDLDLLITLQRGRSLLDLVAIKQDLEDLLQCEVHVVTETSISPYIRERIKNQAVSL